MNLRLTKPGGCEACRSDSRMHQRRRSCLGACSVAVLSRVGRTGARRLGPAAETSSRLLLSVLSLAENPLAYCNGRRDHEFQGGGPALCYDPRGPMFLKSLVVRGFKS